MDAARSGGWRAGALPVLALAVVVGLGLGLRLVGLADHTLTHAEVYVPRLSMPAYVSAPPPRASLAEAIVGTLHHDNHPPGYYAAMWAWTGVAGTGLFALRLPSALAGAATVALLFVVVRRREGAAIALTAAALLALHGHHIYWSQQARMWALLAFFAVLSLERLLAFERRPARGTALVYLLAVASGLWLDYSFWPFVAAQMLWIAARHANETRLPATLDAAILAVAAAAPVLWFLQVHLGLGRTEYLARTGLVEHLTNFFLFQWLIRIPSAGESFGPAASVAILLLLGAGVLLFFAGIAAARPADEARAVDPAGAVDGECAADRAGAANRAGAADGACAEGAVRAAAQHANPLGWGVRLASAGAPSVLVLWLWSRGEAGAGAALALPWGVLAVGRGLDRSWSIWSRWLCWLRPADGRRGWRRVVADPAATLCVLPALLLFGSSLLVPSVAARSLLFVTPFALWLVARGLAALFPRPAARAVGTALLLAAAGVSAHQYTRAEAGSLDYQALAEAMGPLLSPGDTVLINDAWWTQPMHYYLPPDRFRTGSYELDPAGAERVWVVVLDPKDAAAFEAAAPRLRGYGRGRRVEIPGAYAVLLRHAAAPR